MTSTEWKQKKMPGELCQSPAEDGVPDLEILQDKTAPRLLWLKVGCHVILFQNMSEQPYIGLC
ncbi:hypothetical protein DPMN_127437 [Dreissena polymorpha]|uniref:Uncharacterized protein n=1 Tax=Dreissena polymorpha TaxID=45954 RepID=A0A9D4H580_DREPO|nr:hypothetical protein DPMN_127437 [Dreissena polymorpha]